MKTLKCLIVDDEPLAQRVVEKYCKDIPHVQVVDKCKNALEAMEILYRQDIDVLFLDINMPKLSGLNFLRTLRNPPLVIITTAYQEYALEGYELDVVDYLKKPFSFERFLRAIQKAQSRLYHVDKNDQSGKNIQQTEEEFIFVKSDKVTYKINLDDILYVEALGDYIKLHTLEKVIVTYLSLKKIEELLPRNYFPRIHKSYIVSLKKVNSVEGNRVEIQKIKLPIGSKYRQSFLNLLEPFSTS
ncbi:MAG: LytR/AlgR family response regulator transcription factor [bacterium]